MSGVAPSSRFLGSSRYKIGPGAWPRGNEGTLCLAVCVDAPDARVRCKVRISYTMLDLYVKERVNELTGGGRRP
jgi:hypothetical protein